MKPTIKNLLSDFVLGSVSNAVSETSYFERRKNKQNRESVLLIPGFLTSQNSVKVLRKFFEKRNVNVYTLKDCLGKESFLYKSVNMGWRDEYCDLIKKKAIEIKDRTGNAPYIVGWSLGGIYAVNVFMNEPEVFKKVITLASPLNQNFSKNTSIKWLYDIVAKNTKRLDEVIAENSRVRDDKNIVTIAAEKDGFVDYRGCVSPYTKSYVINCYHMNIISHPKTLKIIDQELFGVQNHMN